MKDLFPAIILAGGLATRLRPITEKIPKALIDINGEPFVSHQLRLLHKQGIRDVVISAGYLGEMLQDFISNGNEFGLRVQYVFDGDPLLGTAGAVKKALPLVGDHFFVLYGDSYLPCDYSAIKKTFLQQSRLGLMTIFRNEGQWDTSNVEFQNGLILDYNKTQRTDRMNYIDYGLGVFHKQAFDYVPDNTPYDLALLYQALLKTNHLGAYEAFERFYEIGSFTGIEELRSLLCNL